MKEQDKTKGLYNKYIISKSDGSPMSPHGVYFVLRLDSDTHARKAVLAYADSVEAENPKLAAGIRAQVESIRHRETPKYISTWKELAEVKSPTHILEIDLEYGYGWIKPNEDCTDVEEPEYYLSTHTFYGGSYKHETRKLQACGFNVQLANWDERIVKCPACLHDISVDEKTQNLYERNKDNVVLQAMSLIIAGHNCTNEEFMIMKDQYINQSWRFK